jgi:hypothetical protein
MYSLTDGRVMYVPPLAREKLVELVEGTGADSTVQGNGKAGGLSAIRPAFVVPTGSIGVRSRGRAGCLSPLEKLGRRKDRAPTANERTTRHFTRSAPMKLRRNEMSGKR